ncbi:thymidylate synthase (FAD) [Alkalithermobacter thermoalcaliphilus JW-YL-7 = DSM 7308]|uniref:FAD-dependent thymidylate synthase n=1 Tax=Alkalithermobacter thermoalcaliphilus JW-YL-7 = DSM 7308 TaxID=1121328 RepID=A0A150FQX8_CLOPD|nr:thymidylate synthase, flavin-dependent [[Clostridium] paradoxum JW-YL-7 = DSM 7308]SHL12994.1 thymidylate synthase (FAD) [[Clostridium] paradoxum JW-YL-7 = DSM 7308]
MKITLLNYTGVEILAKAVSLPYQTKESVKAVKNVFKMNHRSIARHGQAVFEIKDVSQSLLRQISRHPHINLTVKSTRYCNFEDSKPYIPYILDEKEQKEYVEDYKKIMRIYKKWKEKEGDKKEVDVAKQFLPLASTTDLILSGNYQALYEFCQLRNCVRAEMEIRKLSNEMTRLLKLTVPAIFEDLGCRGDEYKICPERHGNCGKYEVKKW